MSIDCGDKSRLNIGSSACSIILMTFLRLPRVRQEMRICADPMEGWGNNITRSAPFAPAPHRICVDGSIASDGGAHSFVQRTLAPIVRPRVIATLATAQYHDGDSSTRLRRRLVRLRRRRRQFQLVVSSLGFFIRAPIGGGGGHHSRDCHHRLIELLRETREQQKQRKRTRPQQQQQR